MSDTRTNSNLFDDAAVAVPIVVDRADEINVTPSGVQREDEALASANRPAARPQRSWNFLDVLMLLCIVLSCAVALSPDVADPDLWGHVRYGQDLLSSGALPTTATYTFTADDHPWINHENLSEVILAAAAGAAGGRGLLIMKCLLAIGLAGLWIRAGRRNKVAIPALTIVLLLAAVNLAYNWSLRPHLFTYVCFALLIVLLDHCFAGWSALGHSWLIRRRGFAESRARDRSPLALQVLPAVRIGRLWLAVPLFAVWANTHGGFVAGWILFAVYLGCRIAEALWAQGTGAARIVVHLLLITAASGMATLANPYGAGLHRWMVQSLGFARPEISEWAALTTDYDYFWLFVALYGLTAWALVASRRPRDMAQVALLIVTAWQSVEHVRHIPFFAILAGFWLPPHVDSLMSRLRGHPQSAGRAKPLSPWASRGLAILLSLAVVLLVGRLATRLDGVRVDRGVYPVEAFEYMARENLNGRLVVTYNWAQYAIAAFAPATTVGFDGRFRTCYPQDVVDAHFDFLFGDLPHLRNRRTRGPIEPEKVLQVGRPELVLIDRHLPHAVAVMNRQWDWVLLYQDSLAQLWGHRRKYDDPHSRNYVPPSKRDVSDRPQTGYAHWPALPQQSGT